jgi:glycosyltransferase involved in cell wall biosynthesis
VYNARLAEALLRLGHEVHLLTQERHPEEHPFIDAAGDWDEGELRVRELRAPAPGASARGAAGASADPPPRCTVYRPNIGGLLPVYVADRYAGIEARTFPECSEEEVARYVAANVAAVAEVGRLVGPQLALANHLVMGPVILARAVGAVVPYAVKVHGSALEYTVKPHPERFLAPAREGLAGARAILVGSRHTADSLWETMADARTVERTRMGPPGVDVERFAPRGQAAAAANVRALEGRLRASSGGGRTADRGASAFARDELASADALARLDLPRDRLVAFVGKLIVSKGVDLVIAAWPLVLARVPRARLVVVGFGAYRQGLERLRDALAAGEIAAAREIAAAGRALETPSQAPRPLGHLLAFLDSLHGEERERFFEGARSLRERVVFTGRLDHDELSELLPACEALVVPSTFPEAFGMVAVEAAACGVLPVSGGHSGLAEVSDSLARALPRRSARWLSFPVDDASVRALAERVVDWLLADPDLRAATRAGLVAAARERFSWEGVARGAIAAASGALDRLQRP